MTHREVLEALSGLLLAMFVAMLSSTVVSNALPRIVTDLEGSQTGYTWVVVATLLAMTATTPIWGKLADLFSKKLLVQSALVIYSIGSLLAGFAPNMEVLIGARVVQGLGVGGLTALVQVVIATMVPPRERGRYSGYIGAVFALATVSGPLIGGLIVDSPLGWRGCFFIGLPVAAVAFVLLQKTLHLPVVKRKVSIDYLGATLIVAGVSILLVWVSLAGNQFEWVSATSALLVALGVVVIAAAVYVEARVAVEPIIPLRLFRDRTTSLATAASVLDRRRDVRVDGLPQPVLPARPRHEPHPRRPDVDRDGRRPARLEHRHRPDHHPHRPLEALAGRRHGAGRSSASACSARSTTPPTSRSWASSWRSSASASARPCRTSSSRCRTTPSSPTWARRAPWSRSSARWAARSASRRWARCSPRRSPTRWPPAWRRSASRRPATRATRSRT